MIFSNEFADQVVSAYDLRSKLFKPEDAFLLGKAFGSEISSQNKESVCVGHDRRSDSKKLYDAFIEGLIKVGINVYALDRVGTPVVQYMAQINNYDACVSITASHNPIEYHGFKFFVGNRAFSGHNLQKLVHRCLQNDFYEVSDGSVQKVTYELYIDKLKGITHVSNPVIAWDLLNGSGGDIFSRLELSSNHIVLNEKYVENFGGFPPDPGCVERLSQIQQLVQEKKVDFAFLIDGDADRVALLYKDKFISGDVLFSLFIYLESLIQNCIIKVVWDDISSLCLKKWAVVFSEGFVSKTGHSNIQNLALEKDVDLAGEMSGHYMFKDHYYIDDGIYAALKFIDYLNKLDISLDVLLKKIPEVFLKTLSSIRCVDFKDQIRKMDALKGILKEQKLPFSEFDGLRIFFNEFFITFRASNTEPLIRVAVEGNHEQGLNNGITFTKFLLNGL